MRDFVEQAFYNKRSREDMDDSFVAEYARDFWDWYTDNLKDAPKLPGDKWMTGLSELGSRKMRNAARRGIGAYFRARGVFPDFQSPRNFTEMTLLNSIVAPMPRHVPADKLNVGDYIPENLRNLVHPAQVHKVFDSADQINADGLKPGRYFLKSNHGSSHVMQIDAPFAEAQLAKARANADAWLAKIFGTHSSQWWYRLIDRKVFLEEDLRTDPGQPLPDYRFHVINGQVALLQLDLGLGTDNRNNPVFDGDLNYLPHNFLRDNLGEVDLPAQAGLARDAAREIGKQFPYVRVDFYLRGEELFLGELTFLPNSGRRKIRSGELNEMLCSYWNPMPQVVAIDDTAMARAA
ncbi:ATP-grasp fold amidoligase family protein [Actibacterium sp.]|uniref:ATP-grasp fold amidoligase family protein n=1 Tax=Actibacterium sp. TaxID=1872125 RepID=UPI0035615CC3